MENVFAFAGATTHKVVARCAPGTVPERTGPDMESGAGSSESRAGFAQPAVGELFGEGLPLRGSERIGMGAPRDRARDDGRIGSQMLRWIKGRAITEHQED